MSGRSAKEALEKFKDRAGRAADKAKEFLNMDDAPKADDVPLGDGLAGKAKKSIKGRKKRLDDEIKRQGG